MPSGLRSGRVSCRLLAVIIILGTALVIGQRTIARADSSSSEPAPIAHGQLVIDPDSYKVWPSGSRTLTYVEWSAADSSAQLNLTNAGKAPLPRFVVNVRVDYHDPISQQVASSQSYDFVIEQLAPAASAAIQIPLDYAQCDVYLSLDLGGDSLTVFRTGNPAAC